MDLPKPNRADWLLPNQCEPFVASGSIAGDSGCASTADVSCRRQLFAAVLKVEPHPGADKVLPQIPTFTRFELGTRVIEIVVFEESAPLRIPIVIRPGNYLPGKIGMACPAARAEVAASAVEIKPSRFRIVNSDTAADVGLESVEGELRDEVRHECASVDITRPAAGPRHHPAFSQGGIGASSKTIIKEVCFNGWAKDPGAKDPARLYSAVKPNIVFWVNDKRVAEFIGKRPATPAVLVNVRSHVERHVEAGSKNFRWRSRRDTF